MEDDIYQTIANKSEGLFKDKGSKFIAYAFPVESEEEIRDILARVKKEHHSARHHCYAWRIGAETIQFRANDDGEPSSTAGKPILGQLLSFNLTNTLIIVVRYFGGTLLGVSGLINAYKNAAADALNNATVLQKQIEKKWLLTFTYNELAEVMNLVKQENLTVVSTRFEEKCELVYSARKSSELRISTAFSHIYGVMTKPVSN